MRHALSIVVALCCFAPNLLHAQQTRDPFGQVFAIPGIEFTKQQQADIAKLRETYVPKLTAAVEGQNSVYTREQRQARRAALEQARADGKSRQEAQAEIDKAVNLSDEQQQTLATLRQQQQKLVAEVREKITGLLSDEQRRQIAQRAPRDNPQPRGPRVRPTHANVKYGPHERNVMDVWLAESDKPAPVLVSIHGGGFRGGNKSVDPTLLQSCLDAGISVVAITYRLSDVAIAPAQHFDAARAVQFTRSKAKEWHVDPQRFAATGGSAGAGLSMWLAFHDDLADPKSGDPVLRESSRLSCAAVFNGQTSYDPRVIRDLFPGTNTYQHPALSQLYDVDLTKLDDLPKEKYQLFEQVSAINHLSKDDVPVLLAYATNPETPITSQGIGIHHPKFGTLLKEKMAPLGIECQVHTGVGRGEPLAKLTFEFVKQHLE